MLVLVIDTARKLYSVVLATWTLNEISEKYKVFYVYKCLILTNVNVNVNMMPLHMNLSRLITLLPSLIARRWVGRQIQ